MNFGMSERANFLDLISRRALLYWQLPPGEASRMAEELWLDLPWLLDILREFDSDHIPQGIWDSLDQIDNRAGEIESRARELGDPDPDPAVEPRQLLDDIILSVRAIEKKSDIIREELDNLGGER